MDKTIQVAIIGIQGVPAQYGGFETFVDNLIGEHAADVNYTVFCSSKDMPMRLTSYKDAKLKYIPLRSNGITSILYDAVGMIRSVRGYDVMLILGVSGCLFLPFFKWFTPAKILVNIDGLEHQRSKWNRWIQRFLLLSEKIAVHSSDIIISDNKAIQYYVTQTYHRPSVMIAYGGNQALVEVSEAQRSECLKELGLSAGQYAITVCRICPENNLDMILEAFANSSKVLVVVGNFSSSPYGRHFLDKYRHYSHIKLIEAIYDPSILYVLRKEAACYIHGHSAGGTNPSLVEAMFFGNPIIAFDVVYNRETTCGQATYFSSTSSLQQILQRIETLNGQILLEIARSKYTWEAIARQYESLYR